MNTYAPIALFVYNRYSHVKKVVEAIKKLSCKKIKNICFSDYSDDQQEQIKIRKIRNYLEILMDLKS